MKLTPKQQRFVEEYLVDLNATQAAIRAGYSARGATVRGSQLLANRKVADAVAAEMAKRSEQTGINAAWVLRRLAAEAEADVRDLFDEDGNLKPVHRWPEIWRKGLVSGIDVERLFDGRGENREQIGTVTKIRLSERIRRLELIGKHVNVNAFADRHEHSGPGGKPISVETARVELSDDELLEIAKRGK